MFEKFFYECPHTLVNGNLAFYYFCDIIEKLNFVLYC